MIFVDSNIPMYLVGGEHPNKHVAQLMLERLTVSGESLVTDAEVFQEILHRFVALHRLDAIDPAFDTLLELVDDVFAVTRDDVLRARRLVTGSAKISARDAIHVAVMERFKIDRILTFDREFDAVPGIRRETSPRS